MPLRLSNKPEIHLAQEWLAQLHVWITRNGLTGYDPFDIKAHPTLRAAQTHPALRKASTLLCDLFPVQARRMLRIAPTLNPKALALVAIGHLRLHQLTGDQLHLDNGIACLGELEALALPGYGDHLCWGYPFPVRGIGIDMPANTPVAVVCAIAGQAFLLAYEITGDAAHLIAAQRIAAFMMEKLPRVALPADAPAGGDAPWCFAYGMADLRRVHNANLLVVEHVMRTAAITGDDDWRCEAEQALRFSLERQHDDGSWPYGEHAPGEAHEPKLLRLVDHHHTGFVLRSLRAVYDVAPDDAVRNAIERGVRYYRKLVRPDGRPVKGRASWPVDIHACAEGILCPCALGGMMPGGKEAALLVMRWTHHCLRDPHTGAPWHRRYPFFSARIAYPRWGVAWIYRALAEYLYYRRNDIA